MFGKEVVEMLVLKRVHLESLRKLNFCFVSDVKVRSVFNCCGLSFKPFEDLIDLTDLVRVKRTFFIHTKHTFLFSEEVSSLLVESGVSGSWWTVGGSGLNKIFIAPYTKELLIVQGSSFTVNELYKSGFVISKVKGDLVVSNSASSVPDQENTLHMNIAVDSFSLGFVK